MRNFRKPHRYKKKKPIFKKRFFWLGLLIIAVATGIFYCLFFLEVFQVKKIIILRYTQDNPEPVEWVVSGDDKITKEEVEFIAGQRLENKVLFFKTSSIFSANLSQIKKDILNYFPQIAEAKVGLDLFDAIKIEITERQALAQWCNQECFLIDKEGIVFEEAFEIHPDLIIIRAETGFSELGETVVKKELLVQILELESKLEEIEAPVSEAFLASKQRLNMKTFEGWEIYFNLETNLDWQITELEEVLKEKIPQEMRDKLEYIDLRFSRVYYSYKK